MQSVFLSGADKAAEWDWVGLVGDVGDHAVPAKLAAMEGHMFRRLHGIATRAAACFRGVVGAHAIDIGACEGMVDGDLKSGECGAALEAIAGGAFPVRALFFVSQQYVWYLGFARVCTMPAKLNQINSLGKKLDLT